MNSEVAQEKKPAPRSVLRTTLGSLAYNFMKGICIAGSIYFMGWMNLSPAWLLMGVASYVAQKNYLDQKKIRYAIKNGEQEKETILATIEDLPAWVFFPDTERAEWVNKMLCQFWPFVGDYVKDLITDSIEPSIRSSLPAYLQSFKFERIDLGDQPPRIGGVKVYRENVSRNEVIMDIELFYSGDCNFKVKVKGFKAGIKELQVHGHLRIVMRPLTKEMPLVGGVTAFFLRPPDIDFTLTNLGQVLEVPGLNDLLKKAVSDQVAALMVLPNKYSLRLQEHVSTHSLRYSLPCGVLRLELVAAKDLIKADIGMLGMGKSDPYAIITVGAQEFRTQVISNTVNPKWNYFCEAVVYQIHGTTLDIEVMDEDQSSKDDFLGRVSVSVSDLERQGHSDMWLTLDDVKSGKVHLKAFWLALSTNTDDLAPQLEVVRSISTKVPLSSAVLIVFLDSAKHLPNASKAAAEPSPQLQLVLGNQERWSAIKQSTNDPVWEEMFYVLVANPEVQDMEIKILDTKSGQTLGHLTFRLSRLLKENELKIEEPLILLGTGHQAKLFVTLQLRILSDAPSLMKRQSSRKQPVPSPVPSRSESVGSHEGAKSEGGTAPEPAEPAPVDHGSGDPGEDGPKAQPPSLEEMVQSTVTPVLESVAMSERVMDVHRRDPQREVLGDPGSGRVQLTLHYNTQKNRLVVIVHRAVNLEHKEGEDLPDPYVKLHLLPDKNKENKRKTQIVRDCCNPVFDETMEFDSNLADLGNSTLQVVVHSKRGTSRFARTDILGRSQVSLANLDLTKMLTDWYDLEPDT